MIRIRWILRARMSLVAFPYDPDKMDSACEDVFMLVEVY